MRSRFVYAIVCGIMFATAGIAQASVLDQLLSFNGEIDFLHDNSAGIFVDRDGIGGPDLIQGIIWIDSINGQNVSTTTGKSLFAVYSLDIAAVGTTVFGGAGFTASASVLNPVEDLLLGSAAADFSTLATRNAGITPGILLFETTGSHTDAAWTNVAAAGSPLILEFNGSDDFSIMTVDMSLGFDAIDDYHDIVLSSSAIPLGNFAGVYTVAEDSLGSGVDILDTENLVFGGFGDVVIEDGNIASPLSTGANTRGFTFSDGGTYKIAVTPEPLSVLVWGGLLAFAGLKRSRG